MSFNLGFLRSEGSILLTENMIALIIERITEIIAQKTNLKDSHRDLKTF